MQSQSNKICDRCKIKPIRDQERGEYFCPRCGKIIESQIYDLGIQSKSYISQNVTRASVSNPNPFYSHLISTSIDLKNRDTYGKSIGMKSKLNTNLLRIWQKRLRVTNIQDKNLISAILEVQRLGNCFNLSDYIKQESTNMYKQLGSKNISKGKSVFGLISAITYILCIKNKIPITLQEINRVSKVKKRRITKLYRLIIKQLGVKLELPTIKNYVNKYITYINFNSSLEIGKFRDQCVEIIDYYSNKLETGKGPLTITCALIYILAKLNDMDFDLKVFISKVNITRITFKLKVKSLLELIEKDNYFKFDTSKFADISELKNV
jgi:transcription initiation factor TFIIB